MDPQFEQRIRSCPSLPSLPAIAVQVLDLTRSGNADIAEIARIISKDPALSSKILRTVNSSFYGRSNNVATVSHALVILGLQSVKTLVLSFSLVKTLSAGKSNGFKHIDYWRRSIYAATAARSLASKAGILQAEEAFLAALMMDIGMLVLDQLEPEKYGEIITRLTTHDELHGLEFTAFGVTHAQISGHLTTQWKLPPLLCVPILNHHNPEAIADAALKKLTSVARVAGRCADVFVDLNPASAIAEVRKLAMADLGLADGDADTLLSEIGTRTKEVANLFEISIGSTQEYEAILKKANETLVELTLQTQQRASQLLQINTELKEKASRDGLTGLANRATFDQFLTESFATATAPSNVGRCLSLLMLDLDKFKSINDRHGHPAGDAVLRAIGKLLAAATRDTGLAARYGGEELAVILPDTPRATAAAIAETIRRAIAARTIACGKIAVPVTASIGVACYEPGSPFREPTHLIKAADLAVYNAKHGGRNCVKVFAIKPAAAKPAA